MLTVSLYPQHISCKIVIIWYNEENFKIIERQVMYRNSYVEINVDNLQHNVKEIIKKYPDYQYYFGVVKGNAYGHSDKVAKYLVESGINYLAILFFA